MCENISKEIYQFNISKIKALNSIDYKFELNKKTNSN